MKLATKKVPQIDHIATGGMVRTRRRYVKLSLATVAQRLGVSVVYLSELERGKRNWNAERLEKVQKAIAGKK